MRGNFDNSILLTKLILRRERVMSTVWIIIMVLFSVMLAPAMANMFTDEARYALLETLKNPGMISMVGPAYGADNYNAGALFSNMMLLWVIITIAVMNIFLVIRHTRADEEKGRAEVIRSLPTGRLATLNGTMITAFIVNTAIAIFTGIGIAVMSIDSMDFVGSMLYGVAIGVSGMLFASIAALFSQLCSSSRSATGYSILCLGILYMVRAAGDISNETLSLISPLGLIQRSQIYVKNLWWPVYIVLMETVVLAIIAYALNAVRDMDQGFIPAKPGRKEAAASLLSPFGLSFRLLRNSIIAWLITMFVIGASYGSIMGDIDNFINESEFYQQIIGVNSEFSMAIMFTTMVNSMMSLISVVPVLLAALKLRNEEKDGRVEHILARAVSRTKNMSGYVAIAFIASVLFQCATAIGLYLSASAVMEDSIPFDILLKASLAYLPALWVMLGLTVLLIGALPKATGLIWAFFGFSFFTGFFGRILILPDWLSKLNPFSHIPQVPVDNINYLVLALMTLIAVVFTAAGFVFYRKRDVNA